MAKRTTMTNQKQNTFTIFFCGHKKKDENTNNGAQNTTQKSREQAT